MRRLNKAQPGDRVGVILGRSECGRFMHWLGFGTFLGTFPLVIDSGRPTDEPWLKTIEIMNPCIKLDTDALVWGIQTHWGLPKSVQEKLKDWQQHHGLIPKLLDARIHPGRQTAFGKIVNCGVPFYLYKIKSHIRGIKRIITHSYKDDDGRIRSVTYDGGEVVKIDGMDVEEWEKLNQQLLNQNHLK